MKMSDPAPKPRLPQSAPKPVKARPPVGILVEAPKKPRPSSKPLLSTPAPTPPAVDSWRPLLVKMLLAMVVTVVFIGGMELGFHRASNRYQPIIDELGGSIKKQNEQLGIAKKEIAALVAAKDSLKLAETKKSETKKVVAAAPKPKTPDLESLLTKEPEPPPMPKKAEPTKKIEVAKKPEPPPQPPAPTPSAKPVRFVADIEPIFKSKCFICHGGKSTKGRLSLQTAAKTQMGGDVGHVGFLAETEHELHHRFGIEHVTLQLESGDESSAACRCSLVR